MISRKKAGRTTKMVGTKKVAAPLRQLPGALMDKASRAAPVEIDVSTLVRDLGAMIDAARKRVSVTANAALVTLYWHIDLVLTLDFEGETHRLPPPAPSLRRGRSRQLHRRVLAGHVQGTTF